MKNDFQYKWSKIFASKRYYTEDGIIELTPEEQQELLDDSKALSIHSVGDSFWCTNWEEDCEEQCTMCKDWQRIEDK